MSLLWLMTETLGRYHVFRRDASFEPSLCGSTWIEKRAFGLDCKVTVNGRVVPPQKCQRCERLEREQGEGNGGPP